MDVFLDTIKKENVPTYKEISIPICFNRANMWNRKLYTITTRDYKFLEHPVRLRLEEDLLRKIRIDLRPRITIAHGLKGSQTNVGGNDPLEIPGDYFGLINWDFIRSGIMEYKSANGMYNLIVDFDVVKRVIESREYQIFLDETDGIKVDNSNGKPELQIYSFEGVKRFNELMLMVVKEYLRRFYREEEKKQSMEYLQVEPLTFDNHSHMFPEGKEIIIKIQNDFKKAIDELLSQLKKYDPNSCRIPQEWANWKSFVIHFDRHLYTPLIVWKNGQDGIKSIPVKLNEGETKFVRDLNDFLDMNGHILGGTVFY